MFSGPADPHPRTDPTDVRHPLPAANRPSGELV